MNWEEVRVSHRQKSSGEYRNDISRGLFGLQGERLRLPSATTGTQCLLMSIHPHPNPAMHEANDAYIQRVKAAKRVNLKEQMEQMFETTVKLILIFVFLPQSV